MKLNVDKQKHDRMVRDILMVFNEQSVHPAELVLALGEACGRVIHQVNGSDIAKRELVDVAIKMMAATIEEGEKNVITQ